jgi:hypothetical protein
MPAKEENFLPLGKKESFLIMTDYVLEGERGSRSSISGKARGGILIPGTIPYHVHKKQAPRSGRDARAPGFSRATMERGRPARNIGVWRWFDRNLA